MSPIRSDKTWIIRSVLAASFIIIPFIVVGFIFSSVHSHLTTSQGFLYNSGPGTRFLGMFQTNLNLTTDLLQPSEECNCKEQKDCKTRKRLSQQMEDRGFIPLAPSLLGKPDSCWSRQERGRFRPPPEFEPSKALVAAIRRYEVLHKNCTAAVKNWTAVFEGQQQILTGEDESTPCRFIVWSITGAVYNSGFGNRITSLIGAFLYALVTDRIFLIDTFVGDQFKSLLCNPFPDSSWWTPLTKEQHEFLYTTPTVDDYAQKLSQDPENFDRRYAVFDWGMFGFFCEHVQSALRNATWLHYTTFLYQTPPIFSVPSFRGRLRELFPDNEVFVHLTRYLLHPSNNMWSRISVAAEARIGTADTRIGVQIRDFQGYNQTITERVRTCIEGFGLLPPRPSEPAWEEATEKPVMPGQRETPRITSMLVTSLQEGYYNDLKRIYETRTDRNEGVVSVFSESHELLEHRGLDQSEAAMLEIWLLSFSDTLLISFMSTFGYLAAGLAARLPIYVNIVDRPDVGNSYFSNGAPLCERAITLEACMHIDPSLHCGADNNFIGYHGGQDLERYKANQPCRDWQGGVVLLHDTLPTTLDAVGDDGRRRNISLVFD